MRISEGQAMPKYHIAIDAGGSKVNTILYDDLFRPISFHRVGSLRDNTTSAQLIEANTRALLDDMGIRGKEIGWISGISDRSLIRAIEEVCPVDHVADHGELGVGLAAAEIFGDGLLALSGTGATSFASIGGSTLTLGGYGAAVYDGGSGYWIGRAAFSAAIADAEEHGPATKITDLLAEKLGGTRDTFLDAVFNIYGMGAVSPTAAVAACTPIVSEAAYADDPVAKEILAKAGSLTGSQLVALVKRNRLSRTLPIAISGSVWRSHPIMFDTFRSTLAAGKLEGPLRIPAFEPIVGAIIAHHYAVHGTFDQRERARFLSDYERYLYRIPAEV